MNLAMGIIATTLARAKFRGRTIWRVEETRPWADVGAKRQSLRAQRVPWRETAIVSVW